MGSKSNKKSSNAYKLKLKISTKNKRREYKIYFCVKEYSLCNDFNAKNGANKINE